MNNDWREYFSFTRKERMGIAVLLLLIGISVAVPRFLMPPAVPDRISKEILMAKEAQLKEVMEDPVVDGEETAILKEPKRAATTALFEFDPNILDADGWKKLGVPARTIKTIQNYVGKGGRFRKPKDLQKIWGFSKEDYERIAPYIRISVSENTRPAYTRHEYIREKPVKASPSILEINAADTAAWIALPGIGSRLASRIVLFREKLGGFYSVDQVGETYGLPDSTFQLIKSRLTCSPEVIRTININTADANTLKQHPYIKWPVANAIVQFRQQHGPYKTVEEIQQIAIVTPELYQRIARYLSVN